MTLETVGLCKKVRGIVNAHIQDYRAYAQDKQCEFVSNEGDKFIHGRIVSYFNNPVTVWDILPIFSRCRNPYRHVQ
jgi:hypothetical protein